ncbi:hypothetical protein IEQ34_013750 [Dendrobium chrysotoxum]|uniref:Uncharacterized protein n=1 Tax=Dendrobium chrysotoxum TaxID=161865 RepID=A0AAV7GT56_DENCH|nr:hypothetical protein IEQ34_013750 [Dendrobium chrysotoxum]
MENTDQVNNQRSGSDLSFRRRISKTLDNLLGGEPRVTPSSVEIKKRDKASTDGGRRRSHGANDDVVSMITSDGLAMIRRKFHIPNEVLIIAPKRSD